MSVIEIDGRIYSTTDKRLNFKTKLILLEDVPEIFGKKFDEYTLTLFTINDLLEMEFSNNTKVGNIVFMPTSEAMSLLKVIKYVRY